MVVTTDRATATDVEAAIGLGGPAGTTVVAFATAGPDTGRRMPGNRRTVTVPLGGSFALAWKRWELAAC